MIYTHGNIPQQAKEYYTHHNNVLLHNDMAVVIYGNMVNDWTKVNNLLILHSPGVTTILPEYESK